MSNTEGDAFDGEFDDENEEFSRLVDVHLANYKAMLPEVIGQLQREWHDTQQALKTYWGEAFDRYDACFRAAYFTGNGINERHRAEALARQDRTYEVLARFQSWALLTASEARALIFTGHGGGALALSRRVLELAITGTFIREKSGDLAERYVQHAAFERWKWATEYETTAAALGENGLPPTELKALNDRCDELAAKYGKNYLSDYGWAAPALPLANPIATKPSFTHILQATNLKRLRHFYFYVSQHLHAGATGSTAHLQTTPQGRAFVTGPSDTGLALPASAILMALNQCTSVFALHELTAYKKHAIPAVQFATLRRLANEAHGAFTAAEARVADAQRQQDARACRQLSRMNEATNWTAARKLRAVLS